MKILFSSYAFHPSVGGIESVSAILAEEFVAAGHAVELITETGGAADSPSSFGLTRQPTVRRMMQLLRWSDVLFQNNISLRSLLPALVMRKPVVVVHQTWIRNVQGKTGWNDRVKRAVLRRVTNIAISQAIADDISTPCTLIPNPYRDDLFRLLPELSRERALVFLGRLVSDKGVDLLLEAMTLLRRDGLKPDLTVIGIGPESENLRRMVRELGIDGQVNFVGGQAGEELVRLLNRHRVMVIPSLWAEPFGVVALEGLACGCVPAGSEQGGLKEAIGPCGLTFQNGYATALAECLKTLLTDPMREEELRRRAPPHLARFRAQQIAGEHLKLLEQIAR